MLIKDFPKMLELGLGRAVLYAQQNDMTSYQDIVLNACLHCQSFDQQAEGARGIYMFDLINSLPNIEFYRERILASLSAFVDTSSVTDDVDHDVAQQYELARLFAERDDEEARQIIYATFDANPTLAGYIGADHIVQLDDAKGFELVAAKLGTLLSANEDEYKAGHLFIQLESQISDQEAYKVLDRLTNDPNTRAFAELVNIERKRTSGPIEYKHLPYVEVKRQIVENSAQSTFYQWGEHADPTDLLEAANDLMLETDVRTLKRYLLLFRRAPFPLDPTRLFELAHHEDLRVAARAINALTNVQSPVVRQFALDGIAKGYLIGHMVSILARNYVEGDWEFIEALTAQQPEDREDYHSLGWGVLDMLDVHPSEQTVGALLNLYEYGPCAVCRERFIRQLHALGKLPDWIRDECRYDSYSDTREFIENLLA